MTPSQLLEQVWANPGDLGLRAVVADALQLAGDPRGEFIALQLAIDAGTAGREAHLRVKALLKQHADTWTSGLPIERKLRRFARGFLTAVKLRATSMELSAAIDRPQWSTVEELDAASLSELEPLVRRMPLLRTLATRWGDPGRVIEGTHVAIDALVCADWIPPDRRAFPNLGVLALTTGRLIDTHLLERARALGLHALLVCGATEAMVANAIRNRASGPPRLRLIGRDLEFLFEPHAPFKRPPYSRMQPEPDNWRIQLYRDRDEADLDAEVGSTPERIHALLERSGITRIHLRPVELGAVDQ